MRGDWYRALLGNGLALGQRSLADGGLLGLELVDAVLAGHLDLVQPLHAVGADVGAVARDDQELVLRLAHDAPLGRLDLGAVMRHAVARGHVILATVAALAAALGRLVRRLVAREGTENGETGEDGLVALHWRSPIQVAVDASRARSESCKAKIDRVGRQEKSVQEFTSSVKRSYPQKSLAFTPGFF